jgi:hypothetical protein
VCAVILLALLFPMRTFSSLERHTIKKFSDDNKQCRADEYFIYCGVLEAEPSIAAQIVGHEDRVFELGRLDGSSTA